LFQQLEPRLVLDSAWQNPARPLDVNNNLEITPLDALIPLNRLNREGIGDLPPRVNPLDYYYDISGDGRLSPLDPLIVINALNRGETGSDPVPPGGSEVAPAGFISLPLGDRLPGQAGQVIRVDAEMTVSGFEFNEVGIFVVDGPDGSVDGIPPTSLEYPNVVFQSGRRRALFSRVDPGSPSRQIDIPAGQFLRVYVLQPASIWGDAQRHLRVLQTGASTMRIGWEQTFSEGPFQGVGDRGFDDVVVDLHLGEPHDTNSAPVLTPIAPYSGPEETLFTFTAAAFDPDLPHDRIRYDLIDPPSGARIDATTGRFEWVPTESQGPVQTTITVRATDLDGLTDTIDVPIRVTEVNRPPTLQPIEDRTVEAGEGVAFTAMASDPDRPVGSLRYSLSDGAPPGATIDPASGRFHWTAQPSHPSGIYSFQVRVTDDGFPPLSDIVDVRIEVVPQRIELVEGERLVTEHRMPIAIAEGTRSLQLSFDRLAFDQGDQGAMNDAFEVALLDAGQRPLVGIVAPDRDAFFNWTESHPPLLGVGATLDQNLQGDAGTITVDVSHLAVGTDAQLVVRLVNNDHDNTTTVSVHPFPRQTDESAVDDPDTIVTPTALAPKLNSPSQFEDDLWRHLRDVSSIVDVDFGHSLWDTDSGRLASDITLTNTGTLAVGGPLLVAINAIDSPDAEVVDYSAILPRDRLKFSDAAVRLLAGSPIFDFSSAIDRMLAPGESVRMMLDFASVGEERFDFQITPLGTINRSPEFITTPVETVRLGNDYRYASQANDADGDPVRYAIDYGPDGMMIDTSTGVIRWTPQPSDAGSHRVGILAIDSWGSSTRQSWSLAVTAGDAPNRPPYFVSDPIVDAYVGMPYRYVAAGDDPDQDPLRFTVVDGPTDFALQIDADQRAVEDPFSRLARWTPPAEALGTTVPVTLRIDDRRGATAMQTFRIHVHPNPANLPPVIVTQPVTEIQIPRFGDGQSIGNVSPTVVAGLLARGDTMTHNVSIRIPPEDRIEGADIVLVVDESASMQEQSWIAEMVGQLDRSLADQGIDDNRFAIVGFGSETVAPRILSDSEALLLTLYGEGGALVHRELIRPGEPLPDIGIPSDGRFWLEVTRGEDRPDTGAGLGNVGTDYSAPLDFQFSAAMRSLVEVQRSGWGQHRGTVNHSFEIPFEATAGDILILDGVVGQGVQRHLIGPDGRAVIDPGALLDDPDPLVLQQSGRYRMRLYGNDAPFEVRLLDPLSDAVPIEVGVGLAGQLTDPDATMLYQIEGRPQMPILVESVGLDDLAGVEDIPYRVRLVGPDGLVTAPSQANADGSPQSARVGPLVIEDSSPYILMVDRNTDVPADGPIVFRLQPWDLFTDAEPIQTGESYQGTVDADSGSRIYRFGGTAGDVWRFQFQTPVDDSLDWTVMDAWGQTINSGSSSTGIASLPVRDSGDHFLVLHRSGESDSATDYRFTVSSNFVPVVPYTGDALVRDQITFGSTVRSHPQHHTVEFQRDDRFAISIFPAATEMQMTIRAPSGGIVWSGNVGAVDTSFASNSPPLQTGMLTARETGVYLIEATTEGVLPVTTRLHLTEATRNLAFDQPIVGMIEPGGGSAIFHFDAFAGQQLDLEADRAAWGDSQTAAARAAQLEIMGGTEDGYWGLHHAINTLDFRDDASRQIVLLTDEDRDAQQSGLIDASILADLRRADIGLHTVVAAEYSSSQDPRPALGFQAIRQDDSDPQFDLFYAVAGGSFETVSSPQYSASGNGATIAQYVALAESAGGTSWDINTLRFGSQQIRSSFSEAFVSTLTKSIIREPQVALRSDNPAAPISIGAAIVDGQQVTFPITLTGDGDAWNFDLEFVDDNAPAILYGSVPVRLASGYRYDVRAIDPDQDAISYRLVEGGHTGARLDENGPAFFWNPVDAGTHTFAIEASDSRGGTDLQTWTVNVSHAHSTNTAPVLVGMPDLTTSVGKSISIEPRANDPDGDSLSFQLLSSDTGGTPPPAGLTMDASTGRIRWTPERSQLGQHEFWLRVVDGRGGEARDTFTIDVLPPRPDANRRPTIQSSPTNQIASGTRYRYPVSAVDPDGDALRFALTVAPAAMVIDADDGVVSWHPSDDDIGSHEIVVQVTDSFGGIAMQVFQLDVVNSNDPPVIASPPDQVAAMGTDWRYQIDARDSNGDQLHYRLMQGNHPPSAEIDAETGLLRWTTTDPGTYPFTVIVDDDRGGQAMLRFDLAVIESTPPRIISQPPSVARIGQPYHYLVLAANHDPDAPLVIRLDDESTTRGMTLQPTECPSADDDCVAAATLTWVPEMLGQFPVTLVASDDQGGVATQSFTLPVVNPTSSTAPPAFGSQPTGPAVVSQSWHYQVVARDPEGMPVRYWLSTAPPGMEIDDESGLISWIPDLAAEGVIVEVAAEDSGGAVATQRFRLPVIERDSNAAPVFRSIPIHPPTVEKPWHYDADAFDPDGDPVRYELDSDSTAAGMVIDAMTGEISWIPTAVESRDIEIYAVDGLGGTATQVVQIDVRPAPPTPPRITSLPTGPAVVGRPWIYQVTVAEPANSNVTFALGVATSPGIAIDPRSGRISWTPGEAATAHVEVSATDSSGNAATQTFSIQAIPRSQDPTNAAPQFVTTPDGPARVAAPWRYRAQANDADGDAIRYSIDAASQAAGVEISAETGWVQWFPVAAGSQRIEITATDAKGASGRQIFELPAIRMNQNPQFLSSPAGPVYQGETWTYQIEVSDPDRDNVELIVDNESYAAGFTLSADGTIRWTPAATGTHRLLVTAADPHGGVAFQQIPLQVVAKSPASSLPRFRSTPPALGFVGQPLEYRADAFDPDGGTVHYALLNGPDGMTIDRRTGRLGWTPLRLQTTTIEIQAIDSAGESNVQQFPLTVTHGASANRPPEIDSQPPGPATRDLPFRYQIDAQDPDGDALEYRIDDESIGRGITIDTDGLIEWLPTAGGNFSIEVIVSDSWGAEVSQGFDLAVLPNAAPRITSTPPRQIELGSELVYQVQALDANAEDTITFQVTEDRGALPEGVIVEPTTGLLRWTPETSGRYRWNVVARDPAGATDIQSIDLLVFDPGTNHPPRILGEPRSELPIDVEYLWRIPAEDADGDAILFQLSVGPRGMVVDSDGWLRWRPDADDLTDSGGLHPVEVVASDNRGGLDRKTWSIQVVQTLENHAPEIDRVRVGGTDYRLDDSSQIPESITTAVAGRQFEPQFLATDADRDTLLWTLVDSPSGAEIDDRGRFFWLPRMDQIGRHTVVVGVADAAGGSDRFEFEVNVRGGNRPARIEGNPAVHHQAGEVYRAQFHGTDPDGDAVQFGFAPGGDDHGAAINSVTGELQWTPASEGTFEFRVMAFDSFGEGSQMIFNVLVDSTGPNSAPYFQSTEPGFAEVGQLYEHRFLAIDPDHDALVYSIHTGPEGMVIDPVDATVRWTPPESLVGFHVPIRLLATDPSAATATFDLELPIRAPNSPPQIVSEPVDTATAGTVYQYTMRVDDPDGDAVTIALEESPPGMHLEQETGRLVWSVPSDAEGAYQVVATATDDRISQPLRHSWTIVVHTDTHPPTVMVVTDRDDYQIGETVDVQLVAGDDVGVTTTSLEIDGTPVLLDAEGRGRYAFTAAGSYDAIGTAEDAAGNHASDSLRLIVRDPDNETPVATILSPSDGQPVRAPVDVTVSVVDSDRDLVAVRLLLARDDDPLNFRQLASREAPAGEFLQDLNGQVLHRFDPTLLADGEYLLRLVAEDAGQNRAVTELQVQIEQGLKLGNLNLQFVDLEIPVQGIPITILRDYDTLAAETSGDFGNGWSLQIRQPKLRVDPTTVARGGSYPAFIDGTRVVVKTPEGRDESFTFRAIADSVVFGIPRSYRPHFDPDPGNQYVLTAPGGDLLKVGSQYISGFGTAYNPAHPEFGNTYRLRPVFGQQVYPILASTGEALGIEDLGGNRLQFTEDGIRSSTGKEIQFHRDMQGRIVRIVDPRGNALQYRYDTAGNLVAATDRSGNTTTFSYLVSPTHYLNEVTDAMGNRALKAEYAPATDAGRNDDAPGPRRVRSLIDTNDTSTTFTFDLDNLTQEIHDRRGLSTTTQFDAYGNVTAFSNRDGTELRREFDQPSRGLPTSETQVIGEADRPGGEADDRSVHRTYNEFGQLTSETDHRGNTERYLYDDSGVPIAAVNPDGSSVSYQFDDHQNLTFIASSAGNSLSMIYDQVGRLVSAQRWDLTGGLLGDVGGGTGGGDDAVVPLFDLGYNDLGELIRSEDANQNLREVVRDANGNVVQSHTQLAPLRDDQPADRLTSLAQFSPDDQPLLGVAATGLATSVAVDALNRPFESIDENGLKTATVYDRLGRQIETRTQTLGDDGVPVWQVTRSVYDTDGNAIYQTDTASEDTNPESIWGTHRVFDDFGRLVRTERLRGLQIVLVDDQNGQRAQVESTGAVVSTTESRYDASGRLWQTIDGYGRKTETMVDRHGQTIETRTQAISHDGSPVWLVTRYTYDTLGRVVMTTDQYVATNDVELGTGVSPPVTATITLYDTQGRKVGSQRVRNATIEIVGATGSRVSEIHDAGDLLYQSQIHYDALGRRSRQISASGAVTDYLYDQRDRQIGTVGTPFPAEQVGLGSQFTGMLVRLRNEVRLNARGQVDVRRENLIQVENADGDLLEINSDQVLETRFHYDHLGRIVAIDYPDGTSTLTTYDSHGRVIEETDQLGQIRRFTYDQQGRMTAVTMPEVIDPRTGQATAPVYQYEYDAQGNQTVQRDPLGRESRFRFDDAGRQLSRTLPLGFGDDGRLGTDDDPFSQFPLPGSAVGDALTFTESFEYDQRGRTRLRTTFEGVVVAYHYNDSPGDAGFADGRLKEMRFYPSEDAYYNDVDNPMETWRYQYDAFGRESRVEQVTHAIANLAESSRTITKRYDVEGRLIEHRTDEGKIVYQYDVFGRTTAMLVWGKRSVDDGDFSATAERGTFYSYDVLGRLKSVTERLHPSSTDSADDQTEVYTYDLLGNLDSRLTNDSFYSRYEYDAMMRLQQLTHFQTDGTPNDLADLSDNQVVVRFTYHLRADGRQTGVDETWWLAGDTGEGTEPRSAHYRFQYDALNRLTDEVFDHWDDTLDYVDQFEYDLVGNRLSARRDTAADGTIDRVMQYAYDANDRATWQHEFQRSADDPTDWGASDGDLSLGRAFQTTTHTYRGTQATGRVDRRQDGQPTESHDYSYDLQGRLQEAVVTRYADGRVASVSRSTHDYDHRGIRISTLNEIDGDGDGAYEQRVKIEYLVDHASPSGHPQVIRETHFDPAGGSRIRVIDVAFGREGISQTTIEYGGTGGEPARRTEWFVRDGKTNVRGLLDAVGRWVQPENLPAQQYFYQAFGQLANMTAAQATSQLMYSSETFDRLTGQQYLRARYYDPAAGRFNRLDPFAGNAQDPQSLHKYAYAHGDPINGMDPTGRSFASAAGFGVGIAVAGTIAGTATSLAGGTFWGGFAIGALGFASMGLVPLLGSFAMVLASLSLITVLDLMLAFNDQQPVKIATAEMQHDYTYALIARAVYKESSPQAKQAAQDDGWVATGTYSYYTHPGYRAVTFENTASNEVVLAYSGTDDGLDWTANIGQGLIGGTAQYAHAENDALDVLNRFPGREVIFVGHSLGGGLASVAALAHSNVAVTFNAAGVSSWTLPEIDFSIASQLIRSYRVQGDLLSTIQHSPIWGALMPDGPGRNIYLPGRASTMLTRHGMNEVISAFELLGVR
jgi:RHS repeat-associated protein